MFASRERVLPQVYEIRCNFESHDGAVFLCATPAGRTIVGRLTLGADGELIDGLLWLKAALVEWAVHDVGVAKLLLHPASLDSLSEAFPAAAMGSASVAGTAQVGVNVGEVTSGEVEVMEEPRVARVLSGALYDYGDPADLEEEAEVSDEQEPEEDPEFSILL